MILAAVHRRPFIKRRRTLHLRIFIAALVIVGYSTAPLALGTCPCMRLFNISNGILNAVATKPDDADADVLTSLFHKRLRRGHKTLAPVYASEITRVKHVISQTRRPKSRV